VLNVNFSSQTNSKIVRIHWDLKRRLKKSRQIEVKTPKQGDWCPCSQGDKVLVRRMPPSSRLGGVSVK
jgi:hypothetical protein